LKGGKAVATKGHFTKKTFGFLRDLAENNNREWFQANKSRYEEEVKEPALEFIRDFSVPLKGLSPHFKADPRANGGSLFRIYRDTRFSKDKSPYKTHTGIQFRHDRGKDAHAPGFYLHLEPKQCFVGLGIWHPDGAALKKIRGGLVDDGTGWKKALSGKAFRDRFQLSGDSLVRPPKGFDADHPLIEDLKRKDFIAVARLTQKEVMGPDFLKEFTRYCRAGGAFMAYLCKVLGFPY
jgi:uncharacterized protein (TIGR02453 family)